MARASLRFAYLFLALAVLIVGIFLWGYAQFVRPGPLASSATVVVPRGAGLAIIAERLKRAGVIADPMVFRLGARITGADKALRAGEYAFPARVSPKEALALLRSGRTVVRRLTVVEGLTSAEIVAQLEKTEGLKGAAGPPPAEGSLLPETYHFTYGDSRKGLLERMARAMERTLATLWADRDPRLPLASPREALILASIVEKETAVADERPRIAGVFLNRLAKGMRLQSDPAVAYGLHRQGRALGRPLTRQDLKRPTPFNTYLIDGLPPSPICNPGRAAIEAVMRPLWTEDLYFVADGNGGHVFARTLKQHNRNAERWRKIQNGHKGR